jgi:tetratricopeptide (TPR) repeat protein
VLRDAYDHATAVLPADDAMNLPTIRELYAWELAKIGRLDEGASLLADSTAAWRRREAGSAWMLAALERSAYVMVDRGDFAEARGFLDEAMRIRTNLHDNTTFTNGNVIARIRLELAVGNWQEAGKVLQSYDAGITPSLLDSPPSLDKALFEAEIALASENFEVARQRVSTVVAAISQSNNRPYLREFEARGLQVQGEALLGMHAPARALQPLQQAVLMDRQLYDANSSLLLASAELTLARCLSELGRGRDAQPWLTNAAEILNRHAALGVQWHRLLKAAREAVARTDARDALRS